MALLLLFQTPTPQKRHGDKRVNSGRKFKKRRSLSIKGICGNTQIAKLRLHREMYEEKMKKVKPTTGRLRSVHECRLFIHAFYKIMSESLTITEVEAAKRVSVLNGVSYKYVLDKKRLWEEGTLAQSINNKRKRGTLTSH